MFQFPTFAPYINMATGLQPAGLPHSDTSGSIPVCRSPEIFAAYHVFRRLQKPRHPPFALVLLTRMNYFAFEIVVPNSIDLKTNGITDHLFRFFAFVNFTLPRYLSLNVVKELKCPLRWTNPLFKRLKSTSNFLRLIVKH